MRRVVELHNARRRRERLLAVWRDAAECVRLAAEDYRSDPSARSHAAVLGALAIEEACADRLREAA